MIIDPLTEPRSTKRQAIQSAYTQDENERLEQLLAQITLSDAQVARIRSKARGLIEAVRQQLQTHSGLDSFLHEYNLSSQEGVVLMCLAEALLRIPDSDTADRLIQDKLAKAQWNEHVGKSDSWLVNAATWGLMLTGKLVALNQEAADDLGGYLERLVSHSSEPVIRTALKEAMRILGHQFVMGRTIEAALSRASDSKQKWDLYSFDMLGESAVSQTDADKYFEAYQYGINAIRTAYPKPGTSQEMPGMSVKLSALHPRFEFSKRQRVLQELLPRVIALCEAARDASIGLTIDAEESGQLELTLDLFETLLQQPGFKDWPGLGLAVQAYQKRAPAVIDWLAEQCKTQQRRMMLRLVKGAYWDTEIKHAQEQGLNDYPVYTRKRNSDVAYVTCIQRIIQAGNVFYPQFATHNAYTIATVLELVPKDLPYEFQRLHGMGEALYQELKQHQPQIPCRVYAPVGSHEDLLPYLVRRLLENGSNTSFVNRIEDQTTDIETLIKDPVATVRTLIPKRNPRIPTPPQLYAPERKNAMGLNLNDEQCLYVLADAMAKHAEQTFRAKPYINGKLRDDLTSGKPQPVINPANHDQHIGEVSESSAAAVDAAFASAKSGFEHWRLAGVKLRAECLQRAADLLEQHHTELMYLCIAEAGRGVREALAEVREAVDYCRYYAAQLGTQFQPQALPGPTGEQNQLTLHGRGVFACISPWNFPLAIFLGQVVAALAAGNAVVAKPARQTPLVALRVVQLLHQAGIPEAVLQLLPGSSVVISEPLLTHPSLAGVAFTGSTEAAQKINQTLAARAGPILPLIAETGGQNVMIVDSSALPEQVVADTLLSAFNSAGQRCSALRVLYLQREIVPRVMDLLKGGVEQLAVGDPAWLRTDVGPVIDTAAKDKLDAYIASVKREAVLIAEANLPEISEQGSFVAPVIFQIEHIAQLPGEVFGPVLHVISYEAEMLDDVLQQINDTGFGLTLGIHSRIESTAQYICDRARVGNIYINRNMIGAVVGVQPFGGEGLSGTGPKAGGPHTLLRFATEHTVANNIAAIGGNTELLRLGDEQ